MNHRFRSDRPGQLHHITGRGAHGEVLFADKWDHRFFTMLVACSIRRGEFGIHTCTTLSTHYHMIGYAPDGRLHVPLMRILNAYTRRVNRKLGRKGPGWEYRYFAKPIDSFRYWKNCMKYVDFNPVKAGLCTNPVLYPHGTARHYAASKLPPWLKKSQSDAIGPPGSWDHIPMGRGYVEAFGDNISDEAFGLVEKQLKYPQVLEDNLDKLYSAPPEFLMLWMRRKVRAARGVSPWTPVASTQAVLAATSDFLDEEVRPILIAGLLATIACATSRVIGQIVNCHRSTASRRVREHKSRILSDIVYAHIAAEAARTAIRISWNR